MDNQNSPTALLGELGYNTRSLPPTTKGKVLMINQERLVNSFCELVKIDSPSDEEEAVAQHLIERLNQLNFQVVRDQFS